MNAAMHPLSASSTNSPVTMEGFLSAWALSPAIGQLRTGPLGSVKSLAGLGRSTAVRPAAGRSAAGPETQEAPHSWIGRGGMLRSAARQENCGDWALGYSLAWMTTRPPSTTSMFRLCRSRSSIPTSGVLPVASASMSRGWPSQSTVT